MSLNIEPHSHHVIKDKQTNRQTHSYIFSMNRCVLCNFGVEFKSLSSFSYYRSRFITEFQRHFEKDPEHLEMLTSVLNAACGPFWIFDFCIRWNKLFHYHCFFTICTDSPKFDLSIICHPPPIRSCIPQQVQCHVLCMKSGPRNITKYLISHTMLPTWAK